MQISYEYFSKINVRSATIVKIETFPRAKKPAFKIWADFGSEFGVLQTSAQVTVNYTPENLVGKLILGCVNLPEKNIAGFKSEFLLLGCEDEDGNISLATLDQKVLNGMKLF